MIEVKLHGYPDGRLAMEVRGHAGFGAKGQDIVCAAVSILVLTAAETAGDLYRRGALRQRPTVVLREGFARLQVHPKPRARQQVRQQLQVIPRGLALLQRHFPGYVDLKGRI